MRKHLLFLLIIFLSHLMIERYNRIIARVDRFQAVIDFHQQVAFGILIIGKRHNNVENQVDLAFAVHYAEVVHGKLSVDLTEHAIGLLTQRVDIRIIDIDRIHVDDQIHTGLLPDTLFGLVDFLVYSHKVRVARHFGMQRRN